MSEIVDYAVLTCPFCAARSRRRMPVDACLYFLPCADCGAVIEPAPGDCCVFCSHADHPCPPVQAGGACGGEKP